MFIGHYGAGFALKRATPGLSLGWLLAAVQLPDLLWPIFLLSGWEYVAIDPGNTRVTPLAFESYPYSHSLLLVAVWGAAFGALSLLRGGRVSSAFVLAGACLSHWLLDWIVHGPDLPLVPWSSVKAGLGLWNSVPATLVVEVPLYLVGVWMYARTTRPRDRVGRHGFVALVVFLGVVYAANLLGPPPPDARSVAIVTLGLWVLPIWAAWFDARRRVAVATALPPRH